MTVRKIKSRWVLFYTGDDGIERIFGSFKVKAAAMCMMAGLTCEDDDDYT